MLHYYCGTGWAESKRAKLDMGADAYLCCPGPSLKSINPDTLKGRGRVVFGINTSYPHIKPDIWMGLDSIECYDRNILHEPFMKIFRTPFASRMKCDGKMVKEYPNVYWASVTEPKDGETMFDRRAHSSHLVWHKSTLMATIHLMIWMGAKNIYFAGCDMGGKQDYWYGNTLKRDQKRYNARLYKLQTAHLRELAEIGKKRGINFFSVTPDSPINDFMEYLPLEEALKRSEAKTEIKENWDIKHVLDTRKTTVVTMYKKGVISSDYVYRLKESVEKHFPGAEFVCLTNEKLEGIETKPIKYDWGHMVWNKLELFEHFKGRTLYMDATVIVKGDLTPFNKFKNFTMTKDFVNPKHMSSAVMAWDGDYSYITEKFKSDPEKYKEEYAPIQGQAFGSQWKSCVDQKFIEETVEKIDTWEDGLVSSYKMSSKEDIDKSSIVKYHGSPKPHQVDWNIYRDLSKKPNMVHITNWGIWGGVQSVCLSISKEYDEYKHHVIVLNKENQREDCKNNFKKHNVEYHVAGNLEELLAKLSPKLVFLHNTVPQSLGCAPCIIKDYKSVRVHHGGEIGPLEVDIDWFVSEYAKSRSKSPTFNEFILPPVTYISDYLGIERPSRNPVVGRVQSQTYGGGSPYPQKFYELMDKIKADKFVVGPSTGPRDADIVAGKTAEYLKEMDIFVVWQDKIETWGLGATEANLSGIPVVVKNNNDGLSEQIKKSGGGIPSEVRCLSEVGNKFVSLVANNYDKNNITYTDALSYLSIKSRNFDKVLSKAKK